MYTVTVDHFGTLKDAEGNPMTFDTRQQAEAEIYIAELSGWASANDCKIEEIK